MASSITTADITYQKPGTQPPVFVAGTFSDPPWEAHEMEFSTDADGEHVFKKEVTAEPGSKFQYKFRIGLGDWWVLHEDMPTVTDSAGNTNHELEMQPPERPSEPIPATGTQAGGDPIQKGTDGDAVASKTVEVDNCLPLGSGKAAVGLAKRLASTSGTSTPTYASVAAEVADSAALLNKEKPETPIPDDVAGKIGYRRLSTTPIVEVANTAAEVADTARDLDNAEAVVGFRILPDNSSPFDFPRQDQDFFNDDELAEYKPPLFSHEAVGMYDDEEDEDLRGGDVLEDSQLDAEASEAKEIDLDDIDINDPTLERFPCNRDEIIDTVRKLETGLGEDQPIFEGVPPSPVIGLKTGDAIGDFLLSPLPVSPVVPRVTRRLEVNRSPRGSVSSNLSVLSLESISEAEEPSPGDQSRNSPVVLLSTPRKRSPFRAPGSDEDEGVALKPHEATETAKGENGGLLTPESAASPRRGASRTSSSESSMDCSSDSSGAKITEQPDQGSQRAPPQASKSPAQSPAPELVPTESPRIVIEAPEDVEAAVDSRGQHDNGGGGEVRNADGTDADGIDPERVDSGVGEASAATGVDGGNGSATQLRKRASTTGAASAPRDSTHAAAIHPDHEGNWFKAFFRLLFVDWIGGFISKLCGGRRKT